MMIPTFPLASPVVFPAAGGPVPGPRRPAERHSPAAACRSSSSGCSVAQTPGSSPPIPDPRSPGRSHRWPTGCSTETPNRPQRRYCWSPTAAGSRATPPGHSTPLTRGREEGENGERGSWPVGHGWGNSPISLRLEKPAVMGACLGDFPRFGALDDHTLHPSPRDFSLQG